HCQSSNSGIGDFGPEGINAFIRDHHCKEICKRLGLDEDISLDFVSSDLHSNAPEKPTIEDELSSDSEDPDGDDDSIDHRDKDKADGDD
ncbi:hypothetical protein P691DRAFT_686846, partial [Macrolepiota fuliginosa MF-IS2]